MERMVVPGAELPRGQKQIVLFILQREKGVLKRPRSAAEQQEIGREIRVPAPFQPRPLAQASIVECTAEGGCLFPQRHVTG